MKEQYDVVIVGGASAGSWFARAMAARGHSVLVLEKSSRDDLSRTYDVFHVDRADIDRFDLPRVTPDDPCWCFAFTESANYSPFDRYPKPTHADNIGLHKHAYILKMNDAAMAAGAEVRYEAAFKAPVFTGGKLTGVTFTEGDKDVTVRCRLCVDCSGIASVVRHSLPADYGVETALLTDKDVFFVKLRYIKFKEPLQEKWLRSKCWLYFKTWLSPSDDSADAILGMGSSNSFAEGEQVYETFCRHVPLPPYDVVRTEQGVTPYHRALYSFVADGFLVLGDAAAVTKPTCGEGVTAALAAAQIAAEVADAALRGGEPTRELLWPVNTRYQRGQGKEFALLLPVFARALRHSVRANEYLFKHDIIFSEKITGGAEDGIALNAADAAKMIWYILRGFAAGDLRPGEIGQIFAGGLHGLRLSLHYGKYPEAPAGFDKWKTRADRLWRRAGRISDWRNDR
ncbi:MAG: hypothetical protein IKN72_08905 [Clostridia bacterium]|nr:hypothetical protein [Clostridia bacterium]